MRFLRLFIAGMLLIAGSSDVEATVLVHSPPPDATLTFTVDQDHLPELRKALLDFAANQKLEQEKNGPRAVGIFLILHRSDSSVIIVAEKVGPDSQVNVEFSDLGQLSDADHSETNMPLEAKLEDALRKEWPSLKVTYKSNIP
jgi:hypothetical protein